VADLAGVLVAVVDLPVDLSVGFLLLSGCFLSSTFPLDLSAASPTWEEEEIHHHKIANLSSR